MLLRQQPNGVRDLEYERFCLHGDKEEVLQLLLDKVAKECRPEGQKVANSVTSVTDTAPSEQWSSGESRLHSTWTFWTISGSSQRQNPVFRSDNTLSDASADDQTRSMDSPSIHCEKRHTNDPVREDSWTEVQERDPATG